MKINLSSIREHRPGLPWGLSLQVPPDRVPGRGQCSWPGWAVSPGPHSLGMTQGAATEGPGRTTLPARSLDLGRRWKASGPSSPKKPLEPGAESRTSWAWPATRSQLPGAGSSAWSRRPGTALSAAWAWPIRWGLRPPPQPGALWSVGPGSRLPFLQ